MMKFAFILAEVFGSFSSRITTRRGARRGFTLAEVFCSRSKAHRAFTLAEVLITLAIIGVVAAMTIPTLIQNAQNRENVTRLLKFNTNLQNAVALWKEDINCRDLARKCLEQQGLADNDITNFDQIAKFLQTSDVTWNGQCQTKNWLADTTKNYYGDVSFGWCGGVSKASCGSVAYLLSDGTTFSMDVDPNGFDITVDVNGRKPPNRIGKDTFKLRLGGVYYSNNNIKDISYDQSNSGNGYNGEGLCGNGLVCNPNNVDPTKYGGAMPTSYVILNHKIPDFKQLSKTVPNFKP